MKLTKLGYFNAFLSIVLLGILALLWFDFIKPISILETALRVVIVSFPVIVVGFIVYILIRSYLLKRAETRWYQLEDRIDLILNNPYSFEENALLDLIGEIMLWEIHCLEFYKWGLGKWMYSMYLPYRREKYIQLQEMLPSDS